MKCKALEIRWHETKPIFSADLHAVPPTQHARPAHPYAKLGADGADLEDEHARREREERERDSKDRDKLWRLATCGGDNNVRLWLVTPRPHPDAPALSLPAHPAAAASTSSSSSSKPAHPPAADPGPKVEYLATLSQHTGVVNCVRFAPHGEMLASAGDDGNILIWVPGESSKKIGETDEDRAYERESWRVRSMIRSMSGKEIYDLAWSPNGERLLAGSVDHTATIYDLLSGTPLYKIAEHTNYVQGVCWDPRGELIATQSSDRSMHVYEVRDAPAGAAGGVEVHPVGKNSRMEVQRRPSSASSSSSSKRARKPSETAAAGDAARPGMPPRAASTRSDVSDREREITTPMDPPTGIPHHPPPPAPRERAHSHSRRSSTSGSQPSQSPRLGPTGVGASGSLALPLRSPSPAPPLPAVMPPLEAEEAGAARTTESIKLYGDANSTPFFRRLSWSTDGSLLLTPAGQWEDPYAPAAAAAGAAGAKEKKDKDKGVKMNEPRPTVYVYARANVARPPVAHLPGHRTTSIAIRFCPVLFDLRPDAGGDEENGDEGALRVELAAQTTEVRLPGSEATAAEGKGKERAADAPEASTGADRPKSVFDLPYRMVYAVATLDSVYLYDTQQAGPIAMFGNLHYAPFTDLTWSADGQTLVVSSQDGYCSVIAFEPGELGTLYHDQRPWASAAAHHHHHTHAHTHHHHAHGAPAGGAEEKKDPAPIPAAPPSALPSLFAKAASTSASCAGAAATPVVLDLTASGGSSPAHSTPAKRPASAEEGGEAGAPEKKQKKRVAPTLVRPLGS
ncbi:Chromatin assembly factor 1 subunit [Rhodotorula kratochvilovae]